MDAVNVPILNPEHRWECPSCGHQHVTHEARPHTPFHPCPSLKGLISPYIEVRGVELDRKAARIVRVDREDYVGNEICRTDDDGRPAMAVETQRADGSTDRLVFAGTAQAGAAVNN